MDGEELDKALYECMTTIWKAYRESVSGKSFKAFNACFERLYKQYDDPAVVKFIAGMGMALVPAANRRIRGNGN